MVQFAVLDEYEDGWAAVRGEDEFYTETPSGDEISFGSSSVGNGERRVRIFTALCVRFGEIPLLDDPQIIPTKIAIAGMSEIAGYLFAVHYDTLTPSDAYYPEELPRMLGVSKKTVSKYCRRILREAEEKRVGGIKNK